jgi:hypothetical protein
VVLGTVVVVVVLVVVGTVVVVVVIITVVVVGAGLPDSVQFATATHSHRFVIGLKWVPGGQHCINTGPLASQR